jgi:hypothetical protein
LKKRQKDYLCQRNVINDFDTVHRLLTVSTQVYVWISHQSWIYTSNCVHVRCCPLNPTVLPLMCSTVFTEVPRFSTFESTKFSIIESTTLPPASIAAIFTLCYERSFIMIYTLFIDSKRSYTEVDFLKNKKMLKRGLLQKIILWKIRNIYSWNFSI